MSGEFKLKNGTLMLSTEAPGGIYNSDQLKAIAALCEEDMAIVKVTEDQRLALFVPEEKAAEVAASLEAIGLGLRNYREGLHQPTSCIGELCQEHKQDAQGAAMSVTDAIAEIELKSPLRIGINGCSTCCVPCHTLDISIMGDDNGYRMSIGGKNTQIAEMATFVAEGVPADKLPGFVLKVIEIYRDSAEEEETLQDVIERKGTGEFVAALAPYSQDAADSGDPFEFAAEPAEDEVGEEEDSAEQSELDLLADDDIPFEDDVDDAPVVADEALEGETLDDISELDPSTSNTELEGDVDIDPSEFDQQLDDPSLLEGDVPISGDETEDLMADDSLGLVSAVANEPVMEEAVMETPVDSDDDLELPTAETMAVDEAELEGLELDDSTLDDDDLDGLELSETETETENLDSLEGVEDLVVDEDDALETAGFDEEVALEAVSLDGDLGEEVVLDEGDALEAASFDETLDEEASVEGLNDEIAQDVVEDTVEVVEEVSEEDEDAFENKFNEELEDSKNVPVEDEEVTGERNEAMRLAEDPSEVAAVNSADAELELEASGLDEDLGFDQEEVSEATVSSISSISEEQTGKQAEEHESAHWALKGIHFVGQEFVLEFSTGVEVHLDPSTVKEGEERVFDVGGEQVTIFTDGESFSVESDGIRLVLPMKKAS